MAIQRCKRHKDTRLSEDINGVPHCWKCRREDEIDTRHALKLHDARITSYAALSQHADGLQTLD